MLYNFKSNHFEENSIKEVRTVERWDFANGGDFAELPNISNFTQILKIIQLFNPIR